MATPVMEIHSMLQDMEVETAKDVVNHPDPDSKRTEDIILAVQIAVAYVGMSYFKLDGFLPNKVVEIFGSNSIIVNVVWMLIIFFALRYWVQREWEKQAKKKVPKRE